MASSSEGFNLSFYGGLTFERMSEGSVLAILMHEQDPHSDLSLSLNIRRVALQKRRVYPSNPEVNFVIPSTEFELVRGIVADYIDEYAFEQRQIRAFDNRQNYNGDVIIPSTRDIARNLSRISIEQTLLSGIHQEISDLRQGQID